MPRPFLIFSLSELSIWSGLSLWINILNGKQCRSRSVGFWRSQLMDLHCLPRQDISRFCRTRVKQHFTRNFISCEAEVNILFSGWQILVLTSIECINCRLSEHINKDNFAIINWCILCRLATEYLVLTNPDVNLNRMHHLFCYVIIFSVWQQWQKWCWPVRNLSRAICFMTILAVWQQ